MIARERDCMFHDQRGETTETVENLSPKYNK